VFAQVSPDRTLEDCCITFKNFTVRLSFWKVVNSAMTTFVPTSLPGDMTTFNIHHGFAESLVRGMRNSFLADSDYHHLTQCESLEDVKLNLTESDYSEALADMGSISPNELQKQAIGKV
jgi:ATP synthase (C/AC39) subunit